MSASHGPQLVITFLSQLYGVQLGPFQLLDDRPLGVEDAVDLLRVLIDGLLLHVVKVFVRC